MQIDTGYVEDDQASVSSAAVGTGHVAAITITNRSPAHTVLYRVQTTSPSCYKVRQGHGGIQPSASVVVHIAYIQPSEKGARDKFRVSWVAMQGQQAVMTEAEFSEAYSKCGRPHDIKLRCVLPAILLPPEEPARAAEDKEAESAEGERKPFLSANASSGAVSPVNSPSPSSSSSNKESVYGTRSESKDPPDASARGLEDLKAKNAELERRIAELTSASVSASAKVPPVPSAALTTMNRETRCKRRSWLPSRDTYRRCWSS